MYKDVRFLSNQRELEYLKRKEIEQKKEEVIFKITKLDLNVWKSAGQ